MNSDFDRSIPQELFNCIKKENLKFNSEEKNEYINHLKYFSQVGYCFGDWDILLKNKKITCAFAAEKSEILMISKEYFMEFFSHSILKCEAEKKNFIRNTFLIFENENEHFNDFYYDIHPIVINFYLLNKYVDQNKQILSQGDSAEYFYIIYSGSCILQKNFFLKDEENLKELETENDYWGRKSHDIMHLTRGGFAGIEGIFSEEKKFKFSLKVKYFKNYFYLYKIN